MVEQRGDQLSLPSLDCPEAGIAHSVVDGVIPAFQPEETDPEPMQRCHDRLVAEGVDLTGFTSAASAADLAD